MVALTRDNIFVLQLAVEHLLTATQKNLRAAAKRHNDKETKTLTELRSGLRSARLKLLNMQRG